MNLYRYVIPVIKAGLVLLAFPFQLCAQKSDQVLRFEDVDTNYIKTYPKEFPGRFFFSQKYTAIELGSSKSPKNLRYRPNTTLNVGVGVTYKIYTLNLAYGFPFLNQDKGKGKTRYLDLQSHIYPRHWTIDFNGQFYKGYFLFPRGFANSNPDKYYVRPDMGVSLFGLTMYNLLNGRKFSFKAPLIQTEWQQKSSGTLLVGGEIYAGAFSADSAIVPSLLQDEFAQYDVNRIRFLEIGPGGGYAYTLVIRKHFFIMGSATVNLDVGYSREYSMEKSQYEWSLRPNILYRGVVGYNSRLWNLNFSWVGNRIAVMGSSSSDPYYFRTGNLRLTLAKRFTPGPKMVKKLQLLAPNN